MRWDAPRRDLGRSEVIALGTLLLLATAQRAWNACILPPLTGYDAPGNAGYILTIVAEHRLPHPLEGWSTFHPLVAMAVVGRAMFIAFTWKSWAAKLPGSHIAAAMDLLLGAR